MKSERKTSSDSNLSNDLFTIRWSSIVSLIISVVFILYIQKIRQYLDNIESCKCAPLEYVHAIAKFETVFLYLLYIMCGIYFVGSVYPQSLSILSKHLSESMIHWILPFTFLYKLALILLTLIFVYNVYEYYTHLSPECSCIDQIDSLMMYLQSFFYLAQYGIPAVMFVVSVISLYRKYK